MSEIKPIKRLIPLGSLLILFSIGPILFAQGASVTQITPQASDTSFIPTPVYPFPTEKQKLVRSYIASSDVFFHKGDYDSAIAEIRKALAVDPNDHYAQTELDTYLKIKEDSKNWFWRFKRGFWIAVNNTLFSKWFYILSALAIFLFEFYYSRQKDKRAIELKFKANEKSETLWRAAKKSKIWIIFNLLGLLSYLFICLSYVPEMTPLLMHFGPSNILILWVLILVIAFVDMGWLFWNLREVSGRQYFSPFLSFACMDVRDFIS